MKKFIILSLLLCVYAGTFAKQRIITFGGDAAGYSTGDFVISVGDTITWLGDFSIHPLRSTSVPDGAAPFSCLRGTTFSYAVMVQGHYAFQSTTEGSVSMRCEFYGYVISGSIDSGDATTTLYIARENNINIISSTLNDKELTGFTATIYNLSGKLMMSMPVTFSRSKYILPKLYPGFYIVRVEDAVGHVAGLKVWQP